MITAVDQAKQQAFVQHIDGQINQVAYLMKHFPYATPGTPQSKYYVMLINDVRKSNCWYHTYYENGTKYASDLFPYHWFNGTSYYIENYMNFSHLMIKSTNATVLEDDWYSNKTCTTSIGHQTYPCEQIYFKKNTNIPLRYFNVRTIAGYDTRIEIPFTVLSTEKSIDNYFETIPKDWQRTCQNDDPSFI